MTGFEFTAPQKIVFGRGSISRLGELAAGLGRRALVAVGSKNKQSEAVEALLEKAGIEAFIFRVEGEPTIASIQRGVSLARGHGCDCVVSLGGGSAIDTGKAVATLHTNPGEMLDYLEVVGQGLALTQPGLPHIAVPTTAGSGAEATRNAVLGVPERGVKVSLRSPYMLPRVALVDAELTVSMPSGVTASTGLDAMTQLIEAFVSNKANPFTDALCREGLGRAAHSLRRAFHDGGDIEAREDMCLASLFSGLALANAKLGLVHGFAGVLGGMFEAPHGAVCAGLLAQVMEANLSALRSRAAHHPAVGRYKEIARILTGDPAADEEQGAAWVHIICAEFAIPGLSGYGLGREAFPAVVEKTRRASSTQGNPVVLSDDELREVLEKSL